MAIRESNDNLEQGGEVVSKFRAVKISIAQEFGQCEVRSYIFKDVRKWLNR